MFDDELIPSEGIAVLAKLAAAGRFHDDWRYHLANAAGRPRCGALLNMHEWQLRTMPHLPRGVCARCARSYSPRGPRTSMHIDADPREDDQQLLLPLDEDHP